MLSQFKGSSLRRMKSRKYKMKYSALKGACASEKHEGVLYPLLASWSIRFWQQAPSALCSRASSYLSPLASSLPPHPWSFSTKAPWLLFFLNCSKIYIIILIILIIHKCTLDDNKYIHMFCNHHCYLYPNLFFIIPNINSVAIK